jgi:hypothetical protein
VHAVELYAIIQALDLAAGLWTAFVIEGATKFIGLAFFFIPGQIGASEGASSTCSACRPWRDSRYHSFAESAARSSRARVSPRCRC